MIVDIDRLTTIVKICYRTHGSRRPFSTALFYTFLIAPLPHFGSYRLMVVSALCHTSPGPSLYLIVSESLSQASIHYLHLEASTLDPLKLAIQCLGAT